MNGPDKAFDQGDLFLGVLDAIIAIGVTLTNAEMLDRQELAVAFAETARQQREQGASESRKIAVDYLGKFFALAVRGDRRGLRLINGGRVDDAPAPDDGPRAA